MDLCDAKNLDIPQDIKEAGKEFDRLHLLVMNAMKECTKWTASTMVNEKTQLTEHIEQLNTVAIQLDAFHKECKASLAQQRVESQKANRSAVSFREKAIRPYLTSSTPPVLARWLYSEGIIVPAKQDPLSSLGSAVVMEDSQDRGDDLQAAAPAKPTTPSDKESKHDASNPLLPNPLLPQATTAPPSELGLFTLNFEVGNDGKVNIEQPTVLIDEAQKSVWSIVDSFGQGRIKNATTTMGNFFESNPSDTTAMLRLAPKGAGHDQVEASQWLPACMKDNHIFPESLAGVGSPWLLSGQPGSARYGKASWNFPGIGRFVVVISGPVFLVNFPFKAVIERGCNPSDAFDWLFGTSQKVFNAFAQDNFKVTRIPSKHIVWVPYGWTSILVTPSIENSSTSSVLDVPIFSGTLMAGVDIKDELVALNRAITAIQVEQKTGSWANFGPSFIQWLNAISPEVEVEEEEEEP